MRRPRFLPLCALLGVLFAGLPPNLQAQDGKLNKANTCFTMQVHVRDNVSIFDVFSSLVLAMLLVTSITQNKIKKKKRKFEFFKPTAQTKHTEDG